MRNVLTFLPAAVLLAFVRKAPSSIGHVKRTNGEDELPFTTLLSRAREERTNATTQQPCDGEEEKGKPGRALDYKRRKWRAPEGGGTRGVK
jgi:hypothetical protein